MSFEFPRPDNEVTFESLCIAVFRLHLKADNLQKYAKRGQRQYGVDLIGNGDSGQICGVQCKLRNANERLTKTEFLKAIEDAKAFQPPLERFVIATTADREKSLQSLAAKLSQKHKREGLFSVEIYSWPDLEELFKTDPAIRSAVYTTAESTALESLSTSVDAMRETVVDLSAHRGTESVHDEIDQAYEFARKGNPQATLMLLERLKRRRWDELAPRARYRVLANIGNATCIAGDTSKAGRFYIEAAKHQRDEPDAKVLETLGYLFLGEHGKANELATRLCAEHPHLARRPSE